MSQHDLDCSGILRCASRRSSPEAYVTGSGSATDLGGLVGDNSGGTISASYATGAVTGGGSAADLGGLVGDAAGGTITASYATGAVSGGVYNVGGLAGANTGSIATSYAVGNVAGDCEAGGLIGNNGGTVTSSYWDLGATVTGHSGVGSGSLSGVIGFTAAEMQQQSFFSGWDFTDTWVIYDGYTYPLLRSFLTPLTITASNVTVTYDGAAYPGNGAVTYSLTPDANLLGSLTYGGPVNAGTYAPSGFYSVSVVLRPRV